jgi:ABC-type transport system involved in cytochrome c biogenesis permease subunit
MHNYPVLLVFHVALSFSAYVLFLAACVAGLAFLFQERLLKSHHGLLLRTRIPPLDVLEDFVHRMIACGLPLLSLGLIVGMIWARREWGRYWGWDPKETFALITWLTYGGYLAMRHVWAWHGRKSIYLSLAGYALVLVTWIVVNAMSPLHKF